MIEGREFGLLERQPGLDSRVREDANPTVFPLPNTACLKSAFSNSKLGWAVGLPVVLPRHIPSSNLDRR